VNFVPGVKKIQGATTGASTMFITDITNKKQFQEEVGTFKYMASIGHLDNLNSNGGLK